MSKNKSRFLPVCGGGRAAASSLLTRTAFGFSLWEWCSQAAEGLPVYNLQPRRMPEICRFHGIIIRMFLIDNEHPPRHIHIKYGEYVAVMELENMNIIEGSLPKRCRQLVREWAEIHQQELIEMWETQNFHPIKPLE
ncbi:DUF4160 domain-containing protein [Candidatus Electronema sp. JC]|uniref:DUF4160 domain-containing protein n=1 Tax=Candidatus Electronema sp. JC TaxID=3401570 RepID=UPI003B429742